jgi:HSP20 family protein
MTYNLPSLRSVFQPTTNDRRGIDNFFDDFFYDLERRVPYFSSPSKELSFYPQLDIFETNSEYNVTLDLPGISKKDIDLKVDNNILTIKGKKEFNKEHKDNNFYTCERFYGDFHRSVNLPSDADTDKINTNFKDGVLQITVAKSSNSHVKSIEINE